MLTLCSSDLSLISFRDEDSSLVEDSGDQVELELKVSHTEDYPLEAPFRSYGSNNKKPQNTLNNTKGLSNTGTNMYV